MSIKSCFLGYWVQIHVYLMNSSKMPFKICNLKFQSNAVKLEWTVCAYPGLDLSTHPACGDALVNTHVVYQASLVSKGLETYFTRNDGVNIEFTKVT